MSRTATLLAGSGGSEGEASSNSLDETASAELLIEIGSQDSIHIIASSDEAALTMIAEFQQIRTQAALNKEIGSYISKDEEIVLTFED